VQEGPAENGFKTSGEQHLTREARVVKCAERFLPDPATCGVDAVIVPG
jgi:hypothetical protein